MDFSAIRNSTSVDADCWRPEVLLERIATGAGQLGGTDALDGRHVLQGRQAIGRKSTQGAPGALEFVDSDDEAQDLRGDLECIGC